MVERLDEESLANASNILAQMSALRNFAYCCFAVAALSTLELATQFASAEERVKFDSAGAPIQGYLTKPSGRGPFPAVVLLHSCLGLPAMRKSIAGTFANWGYVALFVDDFATRGLKETCSVDFREGPADAFGALAFLSKLSFVDPTRIGAVGYSQGGDTALEIASSHFAEAPDGMKFKAAAAFYPPCANLGNAALEIPTLVLVGELDDVTPAADCRRLVRAQPRGGSNLTLVVYPGAHHLFDDPGFAGGKHISGMLLQYNRNAAERSRSALRDFLAGKLAR
jgi:dienelactone hydrolase